MLYQINVASQHYVFEDLKTLLAKATPERSGDQLAGIAAVDATERIAAQMCLAEVPLQQFLHDALYIRQLLGLKPAPEFDHWLEQQGILAQQSNQLHWPTELPKQFSRLILS